jgi:hypothetical protein
MPASQSSPNPIQPLSVGNVVSAGFRLYRSHLKLYLGLAFQAYLAARPYLWLGKILCHLGNDITLEFQRID